MDNINGISFLNPKRIRFSRSETGTLGIKIDGKIYHKIQPICAFPFSEPNSFIYIQDEKGKEIGVIHHLQELSEEQQRIVSEELHLRYLIPKIKDILKITGEYGIFKWDVETDKGPKIFYVKGRNENIITKEEKRLLITDIENCRYEISDYTKLPLKAISELEKVL